MTTATTVNVQFQLRADTAANWTAANPILLANEVGLETDTKKLKVGDGSTAWASLAYFPSIVSGGTVLGNLEIGSTGTLTFEGSTANDYETTLAVTDPTADRTITLPDQSGTVVVSGNASIVDADIAAGAEIAVSKLANGTANQVLVTDGTDVSWSDDLTLAGNLTVNGTTTTVNTETLVVEDKNIELGVVGTPTDVTADGGGITLKGTTDKTINWIDATDAWTSSERFSVPLGSAAAPSLTFTDDTNTGIYSPGADQVAISTNGTGRLFVSSTGNIGIGTPGPNDDLEIRDAVAAIRITDSDTNQFTRIIQDFETTQIINTGSGDIRFSNNGTERARIDSSGRLLVGTSSDFGGGSQIQAISSTGGMIAVGRDDTSVDTAGQSIGRLRFVGNATTAATREEVAAIICVSDGPHADGDKPGRLVFSTTADGASSPTERMRIRNNGKILFGQQIFDNGLLNIGNYTNGDKYGVEMRPSADNATPFAFDNAAGTLVGSISTTSSATAFNTSSDYRLKENVTPVTDGIARLQQLKPSRFNFIADPDKTVDGFLAHEVQTIVPEAITGEKDAVDDEGNPQYQGIDQSKLVPLLTAALQEAIGRIETLEAEVAALKG